MAEKINKSNSITILSWILIIFTSIGLLMSIIQNILINFMFGSSIPNKFSHTSKGILGFISSNLNIFVLVIGLLMLFSFISAIGLLKRKNWARIIYISLFGLGIIYMIATIISQWTVMNFIIEHAPEDEFGNVFHLVRIFMTIILLGLCILFGWLIRVC